jgi:hypothetical protein
MEPDEWMNVKGALLFKIGRMTKMGLAWEEGR